MSLLDILLLAPVAWLGSIPVVVTLWLNYEQLRQTKEAEIVANQLKITENHRDIWMILFTHPELERVTESNPNLTDKPITNKESLFVTFLLLHLKAVLIAQKADMFIAAKHLDKDIAWIFNLPIPNAVWQRSKSFQDPEVVNVIEAALNQKPASATETRKK